MLQCAAARFVGATVAARRAITEHARIPRAGTPHPLDPLAAEEIRSAAAILRRERGVGESWRFASIELREPSKQAIRDFTPGDPIRREAVVICWNREDAQAYKAIVALGRGPRRLAGSIARASSRT